MVSISSPNYMPVQNYGTVPRQPVPAHTRHGCTIPPKEKNGLSKGVKIAICLGIVGTGILIEYLFRGRKSVSKTVINKIEILLKNKKVQQYCKKHNINTDINKIKEKNYEKQLEFLGDLLDVVIFSL